MCHENKPAVCRVVVLNFGRDGGRPLRSSDEVPVMGTELREWHEESCDGRLSSKVPSERRV